jgi:hypothetical protein
MTTCRVGDLDPTPANIKDYCKADRMMVTDEH